ncbi:caspase-8-like [Saccoglossus kowalevskii]
MATNTLYSRLRELYIDIQSELGPREVERIKQFLSNAQLPKAEKESLNEASAIFLRLEESGLIKADDLSLLRNLMIKIKREPLINDYIIPCQKDLDKIREDCVAEVACSSKNPTVSREMEFGKRLVDLAKEIGKDELKTLKELCGVYYLIPKGNLEDMKAFEVFKFLREDNKISSDNTELLEKLLNEIRRVDLLKKLIYGSGPIICER